jgi:membrane protease YdiL (CAAX protease family)
MWAAPAATGVVRGALLSWRGYYQWPSSLRATQRTLRVLLDVFCSTTVGLSCLISVMESSRTGKDQFGCREIGMQNFQWFLLGVMVAWTPSMIVLAVLLMRPSEFLEDCRNEYLD